MHRIPRRGRTHLGLIRALVALLSCALAPTAAADPGVVRVGYLVLSEGQPSRAVLFHGEHGSSLVATDPRTGRRVRVVIPPFEELLIDGGSFTFTFGALPEQEHRPVLTLEDVTLEGMLLEEPSLCQHERLLRLVRVPKGVSCPGPWEWGEVDPCAAAWHSATGRHCAHRLGLELGSVPASGSVVHWMELAGIAFDWKALPTVAAYCHQRDDPLCAGRFDFGPWGDKPTLAWAVEQRAPEVISALARAGADSGSPFLFGSRALFRALREGRIELVRALLEGGLKLGDLRDSDGATPLTLAASMGQPGLVQVLLAAGAEIDARDAQGRTARELAAAGGHFRVVELLDARERQESGKRR